MRFRVGTFTANAKREFVPRETRFSLYLTFTVDCLYAEISTDPSRYYHPYELF